MNFFLPSSLQKRLLRYALSRLDFLETDDLDLESLDITFGQRSVIELKDVGLRSKDLRLLYSCLPPSISPKLASDFLRLTIPADLNRSGIVVEICGVDIQVKLQNDGLPESKKIEQARSRSAPSRENSANRPRIASPVIHDPGGIGDPGASGILQSQILPTTQDLAASFLESEPVEERRELQAAIESQSIYLNESAYTAAEELGLGAPEGISLPTFVANFLKGIADRLAIKVLDIAIIVDMQLSHDATESTDSVKVMLKVSELALEGLQTSSDERRSLSVSKVEVILLSDPELLCPSSVNSSPKLSKSRSKLTSVGSRSSTADSETFGSVDRDLHQPTAQLRSSIETEHEREDFSDSSSGSSPRFPSTSGLGLDSIGSLLEESQLLEPSVTGLRARSSLNERQHSQPKYESPIDNRAYAEELARTNSLQASAMSGNIGTVPVSEDLSESKMFTHDEAESMYLSAVSHGLEDESPTRTMPGAWDWSGSSANPGEARTDKQPVSSEGSVRPYPNAEDRPTAVDAELTHEESIPENIPLASTAKASAFIDHSINPDSSVAKRILSIDRISVMLPDFFGEHSLEPTHADGGRNFDSPPRLPYQSGTMENSSRLFQSLDLTTRPRQRPLSVGSTAGLQESDAKNNIGIDIGKISAAIDLPVGRLIVRMSQEISRVYPHGSSEKRVDTASPLLSIDFKMNSIVLNICESIPFSPATRSQFYSESSLGVLHIPDSVLLQASISDIKYDDKPVVVFEENVRSSIGSSSFLRREDLVVIIEQEAGVNRTDVQLRTVRVTLDLLQLDDIVSRSGGLSSILELGSSITSASTIRDTTTKAQRSSQRQRSVHFATENRHSSFPQSSNGTSAKFDLRLGGMILDLVGSESTMHVKTAAVKVVYRQETIGIQIDWVLVNGPSRSDHVGKADIEVKLSNIRAHYLLKPQETDLDRLLSLLTPSNDKYDKDDDIMVDTLLRQRRKGSVLRLTLAEVQGVVNGLEWQPHLTKLVDELSKLSSVAKYLPDDDRPGILTFALVKKLGVSLNLNPSLGLLSLQAELLEAAHVSVPALMAAQVTTISMSRNHSERIVGEVIHPSQAQSAMGPPMLMCRFIADEMEPTVRIKLSNTCLEYRVPTLIAILETVEKLSDSQSFAEASRSPPLSPSSTGSDAASTMSRRISVSVSMRDSAVGLTPLGLSSKALVLLTDASFLNSPSHRKNKTASLDLRKASIMIIDDIEKTVESTPDNADHKIYFDETDHVQILVQSGFVPVGYISSASAVVKMSSDSSGGSTLDIELRNNLFILETCADSTQTMISIMGALTPLCPPSKQSKYRTEIIPIEDMLSSFTGNAYITSPGPDAGLRAYADTESISEGDDSDNEDTVNLKNYFPQGGRDDDDEMAESYVDSALAESSMSQSISIAPVGITESVTSATYESTMVHSLLDFRDDHFSRKSSVGGTAHRWNSSQNTYGLASEKGVQKSPLKIRVRDVHIIWNLFDGYDWQSTRDIIAQAVRDVETKAASRRPRSTSRLSPRIEDDDESVIGDFLFNSIYIGVPANKDPRDLANAINHNIDDLASETGSYATSTTVTASPTRRASGPRLRQKKLRLNRSRQHKMTFELKGVSADFLAFPPGSGEVESSLDVRVKDLEVFDHVPTSTWKKFATYMQDAGEREVDTNMVHLEILNVKPVADLAASEMILKISVLPLRLHVDQDALDFMSRFFEFKDDKAPVSTAPSTPPFLQRVEVNPVRIRLDFKPKRVDYAGLRSGRTTEFMNFFVLDRADMVLRRVILYGVSGFDRLGIMLNNIWSPDVKRNQLPGVLAGLAPIRPLVDVSSGVRDLIVVPMREYKKDGRIVRSIQKGAVTFATTTAKELVNLGAKLAIGTQTVLQNTETMLSPSSPKDPDSDEDSKKQISLYADQPLGIVQGLRGAYASLERDLLLARDAIVAVPGEVMASGSATGAAKAVLRSSPTIILRPAIGVSTAVGQALLGAGNSMDGRMRRRVEEKYKRH